MNDRENMSFLDKIIAFCLNNKIIIFLLLLFIIAWGVLVAPFDWDIFTDLRNPVSVDAIPDIGENQQIVFVEWPGRSPQDVEDQITYPLTTALLGLPGVENIRSFSMMGFSTIYIIFRENIEFYWSRSRILEKLNSLPPGTLPDAVRPNLGPDATALGQVFWYTLEGRDPQGRPTGGWDLHELRTIQDYIVRYALMSAQGVSEVASVGGFVQEYQIDVDPDALRNYGITLPQVIQAVKSSNLDVGAGTLEINNVEYVIRGIGFVKESSDLENAVITSVDNVPIFIKNVARVSKGPALRRGALDKAGGEAVGGVVVVRYNENPLQAIQNVKEKIAEIAPGLPQKKLDDGGISQVTIVPFYDRTELIYETLNTLNTGLSQQILITIIVVLLLVMHLRSSILISAMLPLAVLMTFVAMKLFGVDANIVALSGIVIAVGTIVDMGIVITENIFKHLQSRDEDTSTFKVVFTATREVAGAVTTAVLTTIVSFLPVFTLQAAEGKLFRPLAFTKTFALFSSIVLALLVIPPLAQLFFTGRIRARRLRQWIYLIGLLLGILVSIFFALAAGLIIILLSSAGLIQFMLPALKANRWLNIALVVLVTFILAAYWMPLGIGKGVLNFFFVAVTITFFLGFFQAIKHYYPRILRWALDHKIYFLVLPVTIVLLGILTWLGFETLFEWLPRPVKRFAPVSAVAHAFPGLGKEFMPSLDEGAFLYMPTTMPHASIGEVMDVLRKQDMALQALPEIESAVGKLGRVESALDPAPLSMIETAIGGKTISRSVEGRERYPIRIRYPRELRNSLDDLRNIVIPAADGIQLPLGQVASIDYVRGPQMIKSEDTFLTAYVIFDKKEGHAEIDVVDQAKTYLKHKMENQEFTLPAGVSYRFAGNYENQARAQNRLMIIIPVSLFVIFLILYFKFRSVITTTLIFSSIAVAWGGGFLLIWLYGQPWFLDVSLPGIDLRQLFQVHPVNLSVAIWVGFLALFGIASDDGVIITTYLEQQFNRQKPDTISKIRETTIEAGLRRVRPMLMTTATTVLALLPILTSTGRGSDIMVPMAIPVFGGMLVAIITMFVIPVFYAMLKEHQLRKEK